MVSITHESNLVSRRYVLLAIWLRRYPPIVSKRHGGHANHIAIAVADPDGVSFVV